MADLVEAYPATLHAVIEVVRRQEHQVAAPVPIRLHYVVHVRAHVLLMTREDDEVVEPRKMRSAVDALEVVVGEHIGVLAVQGKPPQERLVVAAEVRGNPPVQERAGQIDAPDA